MKMLVGIGDSVPACYILRTPEILILSAMPQPEVSRNWLPSLGLVMALHAAIWWGLTHFKDDTTHPVLLPVVNVTLPPPPELPRIEQPQLRPEPPRPQQQRQSERLPAPRPVVVAAAPTPVAVEEAKPAQPVAPAPEAVSAPPAPASPAPEAVVVPPRYNAAYLSNPPPNYPLAARRRGIEGTTLVRAEVTPEGLCLRAELKKGSGSEMLDHAALEAVKKWRFVPAQRGNQAVIAWVEVPITFKLEN